MITFDFQDGNGPVPAHKHSNGGGWVANTATAAPSAHVRVFGNAKVHGDARVYEFAKVFGNAQVYGYAQVYGLAKVYGDFRVNKGLLHTGHYSSILDTLDNLEL